MRLDIEMMKISGYCKCPKQLSGGVLYTGYGFEKRQDILVCQNCGLAAAPCDFCTKPSFGVLSGGYACLKHIHFYVKQVHDWQEKIGVKKTKFSWLAE